MSKMLFHVLAIVVITVLGLFAFMVSGGVNDDIKHPGHFNQTEKYQYYGFYVTTYLILVLVTLIYLKYYSSNNVLMGVPLALVTLYSLFHIYIQLGLLLSSRSDFFELLPFAGVSIIGNGIVLIHAARKIVHQLVTRR